jgi:hypothetical protein
LGVDTVAAAIGQSGLAGDLTLTGRANFTSLTFIIAFTAMFAIRLQIYAQCAADRLSDGTTQFALAVFADLTAFTGICTNSTMRTVGLSIDATTATID